MSQAPAADACQVAFQPVGKRVAVAAGSTLLEAGREAGLLLSANCGGIGVCGRCRVTVSTGAMEAPGETETACLSGADLAAGQRLACRARIRSDVAVHVPPAFLGSAQRLQLAGEAARLECDPLIRQVDIAPPAASLGDAAADFARVCRELPAADGAPAWRVQPAALRQLSKLARENDWRLAAYVREGEVIGFARPEQRPLGLAVDLGCTKIAAYLVDLHSGGELAAGGVPNPQISFGEDLIARLVLANRGTQEAGRLAACVREAIGDLARQLCRQAEADPSRIADFCIVGNTAMIHLLLELPVQPLLHAPFIAAIDADIDVPARDLQLAGAPGAYVHIPPAIGGFVGADHVAMILARAIAASQQPVIGVDIGTNTEIVLFDPRRSVMVNTSVPSGPAFEGGHIHDGMRAAAGAIEAVFRHGGAFRFRTIGDHPPVGLCGSGVIDLVARLAAARYVNERGHLRKDAPGVRSGERGAEFVVVQAADAGHGRDIVMTQQDIGEVQLAKAAIHAGIQSLLEITGTAPEAVAELVVAGAFGSYLDLASAVDIGLLPRLPNARYAQVGNAAGAGAKMLLVSRRARQEARRIAARAERIELKDYSNFNRLLARATRFPARAVQQDIRETSSHDAT